MASGVGKSNAVSVDHDEARTSVLPLHCPGSALRHMGRCLRISPRSSVNDTVADPSYTDDGNVKDFDLGLRIVDRNALAAAIPSWAAWLFAGGNIVAIGSFLWVCFTQNGSFLLAVALGLAAAAVGMRVAERAVSDAQ